ncbi:hypothetical protein [uncultured Mediterranean phage]|nr:hypothetical protein [uncultured Mediterranean phage]
MKKFDCIGFDAPDYWTGYHLPCVVVPVYNAMTNAQIVEELKTELDVCFDFFENIWGDKHKSMFNNYCDKLMETPNEIGVDPEYEEELTDFDSPMNLYFSFTNPVTINGITFLDN